MIEIWIPVTIAAAFFQNLRSAVQKHLTGVLSGSGAAYSRFLFALPWSLLLLWILIVHLDMSVPTFSPRFVFYCISGSISQILATVFLLRTFSYRSFAVGTTFSKLELIVVAILGALLLNDTLTPWAQFAIALSATGLITLSAGQNRLSVLSLFTHITDKATLYGLSAAVFFGGSVIFFRGATLSLGAENVLLSASTTLAIALGIQSLTMGIYLRLAEPGEFGRVVRSWKWSSVVGIAGMLASIGWFTALTLQNASYVRALGQIELLFTFIVTTRVFRENVSKMELIGCLLIVGAILILMLLG